METRKKPSKQGATINALSLALILIRISPAIFQHTRIKAGIAPTSNAAFFISISDDWSKNYTVRSAYG